MTLKLSFNEPYPHNQRDRIIKAFHELGLSYERVYQSGEYSLHRFYGRLPTVCGSSDIDVKSISIDDNLLETFHNVDFIEIYLNIERN